MPPRAAPVTSSPSVRERKSKKKQKENPHKDKAPSSDTEAAPVRISARNEGVDPTLAYTPPAGSVPVDYDVEFGELDYDAVKEDEGVELWLVRVKAKNLHGVKILPKTGLVGELSRKNTAYDTWAINPSHDHNASASANGDQSIDAEAPVGAEELDSLSVLLPRKRKGGKLFLAPKPVTRHLIVSMRPAKPTRPDPASDITLHRNPPRDAYPEEALTHRFRPYGDPGDPPPDNHVDVEMDDKPAKILDKEKEKRKRKGDNEPPKKAKKAKTTAS
ncbi:hypothetical protein B0F90DRAFT_1757920 [Multifurca ochricompacta]|uniref:Uncharacterized protein n=1 Tax=Multifurca ochricompacta TaxID=376703 RepID=A0AAD4LXR5_9AGAM|nr:hypothetical protein B0F90DRAFT_1757920 [Multifurca ochricompacta]